MQLKGENVAANHKKPERFAGSMSHCRVPPALWVWDPPGSGRISKGNSDMRKIALGMATAAMAIASPALAREGAVYFGGEFGAMKANDTDIDVGAVEDAVQLDYEFDMPWDGLGDTGWDGSLLLGYDFGGFRIEAEGTMKSADIESFSSSVALPGGPPLNTFRPAVGQTDVMGGMLNVMGDFGDDDGIQAFVGGGVGYAKVDLDGFGAFTNQPAFLDDDDWGLAWQLFAGLRQAISDTVDMHVKYRYFNAGGVDLDDGANNGDMDFSSHSLLGGITFNFGGAEPPPPPPPPRAAPPPPPPQPPPPPPAPQMRTCPNGQSLPVTTPCPAPPPPVVPPTGERG